MNLRSLGLELVVDIPYMKTVDMMIEGTMTEDKTRPGMKIADTMIEGSYSCALAVSNADMTACSY